MEIKKVNLVSREDMEGLKETIKLNIYAIEERKLEEAIWSLNRLIEGIDRTLENEEVPVEREFKIHDKVEIVNTDDEDSWNCIGKVGWIVGINLGWEFPYEIEFEDKEISDQWLWKKEDIKLI